MRYKAICRPFVSPTPGDTFWLVTLEKTKYKVKIR